MSNCNPGENLKSLRGKMPAEPIVVTDLCVKVGCDVLTCVTKTTTFSPLGKLSYTSETVYTDRDGAPIEDAVETACPMKVEIVTPPVEPPEPPADIVLTGEDCEGAPVEVTGKPGELTAVVQAPGTAFLVKLCNDPKDTEKVVLCDKNTGHKVAVISDLTDPSNPVVTTWDLNTGAAWAGDFDDLEACGDSDLESDPEIACDNGTEFLRWFVKKDGEPTGVVFDTDISGAAYTVTDPDGVVLGRCVVGCPAVSFVGAVSTPW